MTNRLAVTWLLFCTGFPAACAGPREPAPAPARPAASTTPAGQATTGPGTRLGLLPVVLVGRPSEEVAAALGLVLERRGMDHLELGSEPFVAPAGADWSATATAFAQWVARPDPAGGAGASRPEAFLYAEVLGDPRRGPTEVRFAVAGADGALLWSDRQGPADADWQRTVRRDPDPLGCMTLVAERLFTLAGWRVRPGPVDGPMAQRFAARSGLPSASERTAMQARRRVLREAYDEAPLVVARRSGKASPMLEAPPAWWVGSSTMAGCRRAPPRGSWRCRCRRPPTSSAACGISPEPCKPPCAADRRPAPSTCWPATAGSTSLAAMGSRTPSSSMRAAKW